MALLKNSIHETKISYKITMETLAASEFMLGLYESTGIQLLLQESVKKCALISTI